MSEWLVGGWGVLDAILLLVAILLFFKVRSILGQGARIGKGEKGRASGNRGNGRVATQDQSSPPEAHTLTDEQIWERAVQGGHLAEPILKNKEAFLSIMRDLRGIDPVFEIGTYLERVCELYETIVNAYVKADLESLRFYTADPVYDIFERSILDRQNKKQTLVYALISFKKVQTEGLYFSPSEIRIAVSFLCEVVSALKNEDGTLAEGNPTEARLVRDHWVFMCDRTKGTPRWIVIETS